MKRLDSIENGQVQLEIVECDCGFHLGLDYTYIDQVEDIHIKCPSCGKLIKTEEVLAD